MRLKSNLVFLFLLLTAPTAAAQVRPPENFDIEGHRGARGLKPENTLPAFETALDLGVTTLELDLHFTADGSVVVWHDDAIGGDKCRLGPDAQPDTPDGDRALLISRLTFEQVRAYRCDRNPDPTRFPDQTTGPTLLAGNDFRIIALDELFAFVEAYSRSDDKSEAQRENAARVQFNIETKRKPDDPEAINDGFDGENAGPFELAILDGVAQHGLEDRVIIQSFDHRSLWAIRAVNADIRLAALTAAGFPDLAGFSERGATIWSPDFRTVDSLRLRSAQEHGLRVIPWTVNDPDDMRRLIAMGVDGLITDRPDILLALVGAE